MNDTEQAFLTLQYALADRATQLGEPVDPRIASNIGEVMLGARDE